MNTYEACEDALIETSRIQRAALELKDVEIQEDNDDEGSGEAG